MIINDKNNPWKIVILEGGDVGGVVMEGGDVRGVFMEGGMSLVWS